MVSPKFAPDIPWNRARPGIRGLRRRKAAPGV